MLTRSPAISMEDCCRDVPATAFGSSISRGLGALAFTLNLVESSYEMSSTADSGLTLALHLIKIKTLSVADKIWIRYHYDPVLRCKNYSLTDHAQV